MNTNNLRALINFYKNNNRDSGYVEHDRGWDKIIVKALERIEEYINESNPFDDEWYIIEGNEFEVSQIKQKFGMLDIYVYPIDNMINKIIDDAREEASFTCEHCGSPKGKRMSVSGWLVTRCDPCKFLLDTKGI